MPRTPLFAANWKMNLLRSGAGAYARRLGDLRPLPAEIVLFPPFQLLAEVAHGLGASSTVGVGGQDLHPKPEGAHTGDVSGEQLADVGCRWVLCGHSERRSDHGEDDELIRLKLLAARRSGLLPVLCVGETLEERESERTREVLRRQLEGALSGESHPSPVIAYEPVWAIGTGRTATPQLAQETHAFLRQALEPFGLEDTRILYGGSVKPANCEELFAEQDIDGFLIGGASLDPGEFLDIIHRCGF